ncbi:hypothetical protein, partial [Candidatus Brachybacter algidus]|uniref:hypothetical protein n=1 Tax=Candidatus Brachybacter algidus TaxID=2982024 RepID=UPI00257D2122
MSGTNTLLQNGLLYNMLFDTLASAYLRIPNYYMINIGFLVTEYGRKIMLACKADLSAGHILNIHLFFY